MVKVTGQKSCKNEPLNMIQECTYIKQPCFINEYQLNIVIVILHFKKAWTTAWQCCMTSSDSSIMFVRLIEIAPSVFLLSSLWRTSAQCRLRRMNRRCPDILFWRSVIGRGFYIAEVAVVQKVSKTFRSTETSLNWSTMVCTSFKYYLLLGNIVSS